MELEADCGRCAALCCVVPAFARSSDFAIDKPAGTPCPHLAADLRCGIHADLRARGFAGCTAYDCFGAGQQVTQVVFGGQGWQASPEVARSMRAVFPVVRQLHEFLWYVEESVRRTAPGSDLEARAATLRDVLSADVARSAGELAAYDVATVGLAVGELLEAVSDAVRAPAGEDLRRTDLAGCDLRGADLRGANLRGATLVGVDLRGVDLGSADLLGADLRGARVHGADLSTALFVTRTQVGGAQGDGRTLLPATLDRPAHWERAGR